ncbi:MAG: HAMP domain-containing sensor histidine kinase [Acidimicrobiia bacterium]
MPDPGRHGPPWAGGRPGHSGWGPGRHMFRRMIGLFVFVVLVAGLFGAVLATGISSSGANRWLIVGLTLVAMITLGTVGRRLFRRSWGPVGELIDATRRLGEGETDVRLQTRGRGPLTPVNASFNRMAERLAEEDERRRRLLGDLGHELRTPLTVIKGEIEAVIDGLHPPESLGNVIDEVDLMERLLEDLRDMALAEAGRLQLHIAATDLEALVREVVSSFTATMEARSVTVEIVIGSDIGEIEVDAHRLHQVLSNVVSNSIRAMSDGGRLRISAERGDERVTLEIADTGPGISRDRIDHVFERFVKGDDSSGSGLGLSIARDLVEAHGGEIVASSPPGAGAIITIILPISAEAHPSVSGGVSGPGEAPSGAV